MNSIVTFAIVTVVNPDIRALHMLVRPYAAPCDNKGECANAYASERMHGYTFAPVATPRLEAPAAENSDLRAPRQAKYLRPARARPATARGQQPPSACKQLPRRNFSRAKTLLGMIVHHPARLHERIDDRRSDEAKSARA